MKGVDPSAAALFGSENRALVLAVLANASRPLTGYRIAKVFGGQRVKVNSELRRLAEAGVVDRQPTDGGRNGWVLIDANLGAFVRSRIRITFVSQWDTQRRFGPGAVDKLLAEIEVGLPSPQSDPEFYRPNGWRANRETLRSLREMVRSPEKDAILRKYGARTSRREGRRL
jgi:DNA-binding transcriptional ArsR family regulator